MASASNKQTAKEAREIMELKKQAMEFYKENNVPEKMEEILNSMFYDRPNDVYGHLANYFEGLAVTPTITKLCSREAVDSRGQPAILTDVYCMVKNHEKLVVSSLSANEAYPPDSVKPEEREAIEAEMRKSVTAAISLINSRVCDALKNQDPVQQPSLDALLVSTLDELRDAEAERLAAERLEAGEDAQTDDKPAADAKSPRSTSSKTKAKSPKGKAGKGPAVTITPDEPRETFLCGCGFLSAVSQAVADSAASLQGAPLYRHLAESFSEQVPEKFHIPLPMVTILMSGKVAPGKLNSVKEFMVVPRPGMPVRESVKHITNIYNHCAKVLSAKTGIVGKAVNELGALWTTFDRPEQGLDLLQEAITQQQLTPGEDISLALNCAGHEIFDYEKGKYEVVTGQQKLGEDLADYWNDLIGRYPSIIALIDPLRKVETSSWQTLAERVSDRCYVVSDVASRRPGLLITDDIAELTTINTQSNSQLGDGEPVSARSVMDGGQTAGGDDGRPAVVKTSAVVLRLESVNTVSDVMRASAKLHDEDNQTIISTSIGESTDTFLADLAVASEARFLKLGAPCRGERVAKLNRLAQIEASLETDGRLATLDNHVFPSLRPPTPPAEQPEEGAETAEGTAGDKA